MEARNKFRSSFRSTTSSSRSSTSRKFLKRDPKEQLKDYCRKFIAFMCTQIGVGGLVIGYTIIGAVSFMKIETRQKNEIVHVVERWRLNSSVNLFAIALRHNVLNRSYFFRDTDSELKRYQDQIVSVFKHGYDERSIDEIWTFPAALMFSLSIITMIGYGNMVPRTQWGKAMTVIYAVFGIPLYVLYFLNIGKVLAGCFRWFYRYLYECSSQRDPNEPPKRIIVPSTACLWVVFAYIITGAIMFAEWEKWSYLNSVYFCVTSLCKLGFGDFVLGEDISSSNAGNQTKLVINFLYILGGLGLVAMCYNLMKEEIKVKMQEMHEDFSQCMEDTRVKFLICCHKYRGSYEYDY